MDISPIEKTVLEIFTNDAGAFELVSRFARDHIEKKRETYIKSLRTLKNTPNEEIGQHFKAFEEGIELVEAIFRDIGQYKRDKPPEVKMNRAR